MQVSFDSGKEIIKPKILLHACCAVCLAYPIKLLKELYEPIVYFYNPNIFPIEEYDRRKFELIRYCEKMGYRSAPCAASLLEWQNRGCRAFRT